MTLKYTLTEDAHSTISQELRDIKAISGVLATAAGNADVEGDEVCALAFLICAKTQDIEKLFEAVPPVKSEEDKQGSA